MIIALILSSLERTPPDRSAPRIVIDGVSYLALTPPIGLLCSDGAGSWWIETLDRIEIERGSFDAMLALAEQMINSGTVVQHSLALEESHVLF